MQIATHLLATIAAVLAVAAGIRPDQGTQALTITDMRRLMCWSAPPQTTLRAVIATTVVLVLLILSGCARGGAFLLAALCLALLGQADRIERRELPFHREVTR
jgi:hypothetical protein